MQRLAVFVVLVTVASACAAEEGGPLSVEDGLPDSRWAGSLRSHESLQDPVDVTYSVSIGDNVQVSEFAFPDYTGRTVESYRFGPPGTAEWIGPLGEIVGDCTAVGHVLACATRAQQALKVTRTLEFTSLELRWDETGTLQSTSYERRGVLARR